MEKEFHKASYLKHAQKEYTSDSFKAWKRKDSVDHWRHDRMYQTLLPLCKSYPGEKWLTIGDGRYGTDAHYLIEQGMDVLASDINVNSLKKAKEDGFIQDYMQENAEDLSFSDNYFDFVLCKESYHHFPRPLIALYEMIRVAKKGVILIEPNDIATLDPYHTTMTSSFYWFIFSLKQWIKVKLGKQPAMLAPRYEISGNYVYTISQREIEKVSLGLNLECVAFKGLNDHYVKGAEHEVTSENGPIFREIKTNIERLNNIASTQPENFGLLIAMIFKEKPNERCRELLQKGGFEIRHTRKNPYLQ